VLERTELEQTPIVVIASTIDPELAALLARQQRVLCQPNSVDPIALAALVVRLLDAATQSKENERLAVGLQTELKVLREEKATLKGQLAAAGPTHQLLGTSSAMKRVHEAVARLASLDTTVLLVGETGTGKGVTARAIQKSSKRAEKSFITQNCAALPDSLLDSELFGHVRGAFTGAVSDRAGLFEAATGGTLFLDELTEMSAAMQAKLLHVLQEGELRRVGSTQSTRVDVRVICATNQPLEPLVESGRFREDLYYRLAPFVIALPPLRDHREDVPLLAGHFLAEFEVRHGGAQRTLAPAAIAALEQAPWPGNVRQLQHLMERLAITAAPTGLISASAVREALSVPTPRTKSQTAEPLRGQDESLDEALERIERRMVLDALEATRFIITDAAEKLRVNRSTLSRRLHRLGIKTPHES
jgi:transcriptional regulator with GAF, ATPase, and Fis domain